jgi:hypothetical protein
MTVQSSEVTLPILGVGWGSQSLASAEEPPVRAGGGT